MATLYLHIGTPKTGTSYIQKYLKVNKKVLQSKGYDYPTNLLVPNVLPQRNGRFLMHRFLDDNYKFSKEYTKRIYDEYFELIDRTLERYPNIILSEEGLWDLNKRNDSVFKKLKKKCDAHSIDVKILVYLRRQDLFLQSHWAQKVQEKETRTFVQYLEDGNHERLDYYTKLESIAKFFGRDSITVRIYEESQWKHNLLIDDFLSIVGIDDTSDFIPLEDSVINISISGKYLEFKRYMNRYDEFRMANHKKDALYYILGELTRRNNPESGYKSNKLLSYEETVEFLKKYDEENSLVAKNYLGKADGKLFNDEILKEKQKRESSYTYDDYLEVSKEVILLQQEKYQKVYELREENAQLKKQIKDLQSTVDWVTTSFPKKVIRKLKRIFKG